jgi:AAA+ ATPase superfamily predicted ATPase
MLFDPDVKINKKDLFDRERELEEIINAIKSKERLIIIYGVRRVGKTSLINVALREIGEPFIIIDVRALYFESGFKIPAENILVDEFLRKLKEYKGLFEKLGDKLAELISRIESISAGPLEIKVKKSKRPRLTVMLNEINNWCDKHGRIFIVAFDEAQYLRFSNKRFDLLLSWSIDNLKNIFFVITGSEVGLLRDFLKLDSEDSPLRGRVRREIFLDRFTNEQSMKFLKRGFAEVGMNILELEIEEIINELDGIPGWLTLYGYYRTVRKLNHKETLNSVIEEGSAIVLSELRKIIENSWARYVAILKAIVSGLKRWKDIKAYVELRTGSIPDNRFSELLEKMVKYGYVKKINGEYIIEDPILKYTIINKL